MHTAPPTYCTADAFSLTHSYSPYECRAFDFESFCIHLLYRTQLARSQYVYRQHIVVLEHVPCNSLFVRNAHEHALVSKGLFRDACHRKEKRERCTFFESRKRGGIERRERDRCRTSIRAKLVPGNDVHVLSARKQLHENCFLTADSSLNKRTHAIILTFHIAVHIAFPHPSVMRSSALLLDFRHSISPSDKRIDQRVHLRMKFLGFLIEARPILSSKGILICAAFS